MLKLKAILSLHGMKLALSVSIIIKFSLCTCIIARPLL